MLKACQLGKTFVPNVSFFTKISSFSLCHVTGSIFFAILQCTTNCPLYISLVLSLFSYNYLNKLYILFLVCFLLLYFLIFQFLSNFFIHTFILLLLSSLLLFSTYPSLSLSLSLSLSSLLYTLLFLKNHHFYQYQY
jgi:hypothetical protein